MAYIDTKHLGKCETCRHLENGGCNTYCDHGEEYSPNLSKIPTADVVPKSEVEELKAIIADCKANEERWQELYADTVDKWEKAYEELEIKLARLNAVMKEMDEQRAYTINMLGESLEKAKSEVEDYKHNWQKIHDSYNADCLEHYNKGQQDAAREIFEEIEEDVLDFPMKDIDIHIILDKGRYDKLKKKYTEGRT